MKTQQSVFTKTWPENHPQTPPAELRRSHFCGVFNQHLHLAVSCTCVINKMRDLLSASSQKQSFCCKRRASTSLCLPACTCFTVRTRRVKTRIHIPLAKWGCFGEMWTFWLFLNGCWGLRLGFKVQVRNGFQLRVSLRYLIVMVRYQARDSGIDCVNESPNKGTNTQNSKFLQRIRKETRLTKLQKTKINEW